MKRLLLVFLVVYCCNHSFGQHIPDFGEIKLEAKSDFNPAIDEMALKASNFLFSTPFDSKNIDRLKSLQFVIRWMMGTPDYTFSLDQQATKFARKNDDLLGLYMAAMAKYALENKNFAKDQDLMRLNAVKLIISYVRDSNNKVKISGELKKMLEADEKGKLSEYLKI